MRKRFLLRVILTLCLGSTAPLQAATYYVDAANGRDDNSGTDPGQAWQTLNRVRSSMRSGDTVLLRRGALWRSQLTLYGLSNITLGAYGQGARPVISGSDLFSSGWNADPSHSGVYYHYWPYNWGASQNESERLIELVRRSELVFVNRARLIQYMSHSEMNDHTGSYYVNEGEDRMYIHLPAGVGLSGSQIEIAVRSPVLQLDNITNVTISGITFQHARSQVYVAPGVLIGNSSGIVIDDIEVLDCNMDGLGLWPGTSGWIGDVTIRNSFFSRNGNDGFKGQHVNGLRIENCEVSENGWRAEYGGNRWATGQKFMFCQDVTVTGLWSHHNRFGALWFDNGNRNIEVRDCNLSDNERDGLYLEYGTGPFRVINNTIRNNALAGIFSQDAANVTLEGNKLINNGYAARFQSNSAQIMVGQWIPDPGEREPSVNWVIRNNDISGPAPILNNKVPDGQRMPLHDWHDFLNTLTSDYNCLYRENSNLLFTSYDNQMVTLGTWRDRPGQDRNSELGPCGEDPPVEECTPGALPRDVVSYWRFDTEQSGITPDSAGRNDGIVEGAVFTSDGRLDGAYRFNGAGSHIMVPDSSSLDLQSGITIAAWVQLASPVAKAKLVSKSVPGKDNPWELFALDTDADGNGLRLFISNGNVDDYCEVSSGTHRLQLNTWNHVTGTYDGSQMTLYINGEEVASAAGDIPIGANNEPLLIGTYGEEISWGTHLDGWLDDLRLYGRALTEEEVCALFLYDGSTESLKPLAPHNLLAEIE
jgi:parallel beta-helix repeat protein